MFSKKIKDLQKKYFCGMKKIIQFNCTNFTPKGAGSFDARVDIISNFSASCIIESVDYLSSGGYMLDESGLRVVVSHKLYTMWSPMFNEIIKNTTAYECVDPTNNMKYKIISVDNVDTANRFASMNLGIVGDQNRIYNQ